MKKLKSTIIMLIIMFLTPVSAKAELGDLGFFGGISEGIKLPSTNETLLKSTNSKNKVSEMVYKEVIFLTGTPTVYEGLLTIKTSKSKIDTDDLGTYQVTYQVEDSETSNEDVSLKRNIVYNVNFRKEGRQIIKDYSIKSWSEKIIVNGIEFELEPKQSSFDISVLEDNTAGVNYYKGNISKYAVYKTEESKTVEEIEGDIYGYNSVLSKTETHRLNCLVEGEDVSLIYQVRPSVSVLKRLQYGKNEPTAISFEGNYKEVMSNESGLNYDIFMNSKNLDGIKTADNINIKSYNSFEQLIAPDVAYLKGHFAKADIEKLFSMQVLEGDPKYFNPSQAITRSQFVTALVKAVKLPIEEEPIKKSKKQETIEIIFPDVTSERSDYKYIKAAFENGLAVGKSNGYFYADAPIERQEAIVLLLRVLGLENLGLDPTPVTSFVDDEKIGDWAKREIYAANRIGLVKGDENGNINPESNISKAEAAALINRLTDYMREEMKIDYTENIVNYAN